MKWNERLIYIFILAIAIACSGNPPKKNYKVTDYTVGKSPCLYYDEEGRTERTCPGDYDYPKSIVVLSGKDHKNEIDYQNLLIKSCKEWR